MKTPESWRSIVTEHENPESWRSIVTEHEQNLKLDAEYSLNNFSTLKIHYK